MWHVMTRLNRDEDGEVYDHLIYYERKENNSIDMSSERVGVYPLVGHHDDQTDNTYYHPIVSSDEIIDLGPNKYVMCFKRYLYDCGNLWDVELTEGNERASSVIENDICIEDESNFSCCQERGDLWNRENVQFYNGKIIISNRRFMSSEQ